MAIRLTESRLRQIIREEAQRLVEGEIYASDLPREGKRITQAPSTRPELCAQVFHSTSSGMMKLARLLEPGEVITVDKINFEAFGDEVGTSVVSVSVVDEAGNRYLMKPHAVKGLVPWEISSHPDSFMKDVRYNKNDPEYKMDMRNLRRR